MHDQRKLDNSRKASWVSVPNSARGFIELFDCRGVNISLSKEIWKHSSVKISCLIKIAVLSRSLL